MKFHINTFGCQMNVHDSDWLERALYKRGWEQSAEGQADVIILNTCSVREKPEQKVYSALGRISALVRNNPDLFVAVGGCVAQQVGTGFFERFPFVRLVFGTDGLTLAPDAIERLVRETDLRLSLLDMLGQYPEREEAPPVKTPENDTRQAFVNIMQGCDNFCAYCIVPFVRGRQKSRQPESILTECRFLVENGVREITLLGQNVNSYGLDSSGAGMGFAEILGHVAAIPGLIRLRFTTSHPKDIAPEVIEAFGKLSNLCPHLHLPLQAGSDRVLKRMGRKYDSAGYLKIVESLKKVRSDIALTTDLIVGFPGESDEDFDKTLKMMEKVRFESSFSFKYSDRPGVAAVKMKPKVDDATASARLERLQKLQNVITRECLKNCIGLETEVLFEGRSRKQQGRLISWRGRDPGGRIVNVEHEPGEHLVGKLMRVRIVEAKKHSLVGEGLGSPW